MYTITIDGWKYTAYIKNSFLGKYPYYKEINKGNSGHQCDLETEKSIYTII